MNIKELGGRYKEIDTLENIYSIWFEKLCHMGTPEYVSDDDYGFGKIVGCRNEMVIMLDNELKKMDDDKTNIYIEMKDDLKDKYEIVNVDDVGGGSSGKLVYFKYKNLERLFSIFVTDRDLRAEDDDIYESEVVWRRIFGEYYIPEVHAYYMKRR